MTESKPSPSTLIGPETTDDQRRRQLTGERPATRDELVSAIVFALRHKVRGLTWKRGHEGDLAAKFAAEQLADYLILANLRFYNGPPTGAAPTPSYGRDTTKYYEIYHKATAPKSDAT